MTLLATHRLRHLALLVSGVALALTGVGHASVTEPIGDTGAVNWSNQTVEAVGISVQGGVGGRAGQIRAAELDALRQIIETIKGIRLNSETTVEASMLSSYRIETRVEGVARNFRRVGDPVYMPDGSIELRVAMEMRGPGQLYDIILPSLGTRAEPVYTNPPPGSGVYTGLIVDTRGLGVRPAITPRILDDRGEVIYGERYVDREWVVEHGMTGYAGDLASARQDDRVGSNPLVISAVDASGPNRTDAIISADNARLLHAIDTHLTLLQQARVIFVVDQE